jgi:FkbM family methyltransferase
MAKESYTVNIFPAGGEVRVSAQIDKYWGAYRKGQAYDKRQIYEFASHMKVRRQRRGTKICFFMDVGANAGSYCLLPALDDRLICAAFEPNPDVFSILEENITLNDLHNVVFPYKMAMWHKKETTLMRVPLNPTDSGLGTMGTHTEVVRDLFCKTPARANGEFKEIEINCDTIDNFINTHKIPRLDAIKIDTEGAELYVLQGAIETITKHRPIILFECTKQAIAQFDHEPEDVFDLLKSLGYTKFEKIRSGDFITT